MLLLGTTGTAGASHHSRCSICVLQGDQKPQGRLKKKKGCGFFLVSTTQKDHCQLQALKRNQAEICSEGFDPSWENRIQNHTPNIRPFTNYQCYLLKYELLSRKGKPWSLKTEKTLSSVPRVLHVKIRFIYPSHVRQMVVSSKHG